MNLVQAYFRRHHCIDGVAFLVPNIEIEAIARIYNMKKTLYQANLFSIEEFKEVAKLAHGYYAVAPDKLIFNIEDVCKMLTGGQ